VHRLAAVGAPQVDRADLPAGVVAVEHRRPGRPGQPLVAPARHDHEQVDELDALLGEDVLVARPLVVRPAFDHTFVDEVVEPLGEDLPGDAEVRLDLFEPADPDPHVPQDEGRPRFPDDVERARDGARHLAEAGALHDPSLRLGVPLGNLDCYDC
jgi:hypothetical protein